MLAGTLTATAAGPGPARTPRHAARRFPGLPEAHDARRLLAELNAQACRSSPPAAHAPLVLYGAGELGRLAHDYLRAVGLDLHAVVDRNADSLRSDPFWSGTRLLTPDEAPEDLKRHALLAVSVSTCPFVPIEASLAASGWTDIVPFYDLTESFRDRHPLSNGWFADVLDAETLERTSHILSRWDDGISRAHHLQFLAWRRLREEWHFDGAPVTLHNRFLIPEITAALHTEETLVDCGAHQGSVTRAFADLTGGRFSSIVAIEPDPESRRAFEETVRALDPAVAARISLLPHALDAEARDRTFHDGLGYASQLAGTGGTTLRTRTLDALGLSPSVLKLHLEGGELDALEGARDTLKAHRPIVAATTYHNDDGIWRTPDVLMRHLDGYRFLMRLHGWCGTGAVVYAIPAERRP